MLNGIEYKWIDVTDWEFSWLSEETRRLAAQGWILDGVIDGPDNGINPVRISLRFRQLPPLGTLQGTGEATIRGEQCLGRH